VASLGLVVVGLERRFSIVVSLSASWKSTLRPAAPYGYGRGQVVI
jgi:hypothetical protein